MDVGDGDRDALGGKERSGEAGPDGAVPAVVKAIAIIRYLNARPASGAGLSEIATALALTRSHCHKILRTLADHGWIEHDALGRLYRLASGIAADSASALLARTHLSTLRPLVQELAEDVGFPCLLTEPLPDGSFLIVHMTDRVDPLVLNASLGYRFPPGTAALFKAALAWLGHVERAAALARWQPVRHTDSSITDRDAMAAEIERCRRRGYARSAGEFMAGFTTLALPLFNREGQVFLILSVGGQAAALDRREPTAAAAIIATAEAVHRQIDGRPPVDFPRDGSRRERG